MDAVLPGCGSAQPPVSAIAFSVHPSAPNHSNTNSRSSSTTWSGGRKHACSSCRKRKRKCDAAYPSCSACLTNRSRCTYATPGGTASVRSQQPHQFYHGDPQDNNSNNNGWPMSSLSQAPFGGLSRAADISFDSITPLYNMNSPASWNLGIEPGFFHQQDIPTTSEYPNLALERLTTPQQLQQQQQQWPVPASDEMCDIDTRQPAHNEIYSSSSSYELRDTGSDGVASESRTTLSSHSGADCSVTCQDRFKSVPTTELTTPDPTMKDVLLPSLARTLELLDLFFARYHSFLPCVHETTFLERIKRERESGQPPTALLWALLAVAAPDHPDLNVRVLEESWMHRARTMFDENLTNMSFPTQSLQAAVWILFKSYLLADFTYAWLFLSKACRLASLWGFDCIDSNKARTFRPTIAGPRDAIEIEEQRKTIWALFFFDRSLSCLAGLPLAIDDRHYEVNFPYNDDLFQAATCADELPQTPPESLTMDLSKLVSTSVLQNLHSKVSINHIFLGSVLLGRIVNFHSQLHISPDDTCSSKEFMVLRNVTSLFSFALSREHDEPDDLTLKQMDLLYCLNLLIQKCNILLYHPLANTPMPGDVSPRVDIDSSRALQLCVLSMRRIVDVTKQTNSTTPRALNNPFLVTSYFLCCRFLTMNWHECRSQSDRDNIDFMLMLIDRIGEKWPKLAKKFAKGILVDLGKTGEEARKMRIGTGCYLDIGCA